MKPLAEEAYSKIKEKMLEGTYLPGDMLSENQLAKELGMSRTPIRSAIARLESQGIVTSFKNKGILIKEISAKDLQDTLEILNSFMIYIFETRTPENLALDLGELKMHLDKQLRARDDNNYIEYVKNSLMFVKCILSATHNQVMVQTLEHNYDRLLIVSLMNYKINPHQKHYSANALNEKIYTAIVSDQFEKIKPIVIEHFQSVRLRSFNERRI
ncbi:GntR family transcriptional regulator [Gracilibacillus sp. D59]|uniref:GntR family transcriptional regulator n=1 Tax=Gracilibacillus sp. D59 TaxID=3457434 RepID=UPI003FCDE8AC